jgi:hypothetical protein
MKLTTYLPIWKLAALTGASLILKNMKLKVIMFIK